MAEVRYLAPRLRQADKNEIKAFAGVPAEIALPECVRAGRETWTMTGFSGEPVGLWGLQDVPDVPELGWVWMVCSAEVEKHPVQFIAAVKKFWPHLHKYHPIVTNHVDERNTAHIRWLRWMGFKLLRRIERWGAESRPFIEFARLQPPCASVQQ